MAGRVEWRIWRNEQSAQPGFEVNICLYLLLLHTKYFKGLKDDHINQIVRPDRSNEYMENNCLPTN